MAQVNDQISLDLTLWDGDPNKYVRAWVRADGVLLPESPVSMPHIGLGQYFENSTITFPENTTHLSILYEVFNDAGFITKSTFHSQASESYELSVGGTAGLDQELLDKLNQIIDIVTSHDSSSQIVGLISDSYPLKGYVLEDDAVGFISGVDELVGYVLTEDQMNGIVADDADLDGFFSI